MPLISEVTHWLGVVPLAWLAVRRSRVSAYWWLAVAFGVSWLADTAAHWVNPWLVGTVYSVSQAALIGAVFLTRKDALTFLGMLAVVGGVAVRIQNLPLVITVAWLGIVGIVYDRWALGWLRTALLISFGLGWLAWMGYAASPSYPTWALYQTVRLLGILALCYAFVREKPTLRAL